MEIKNITWIDKKDNYFLVSYIMLFYSALLYILLGHCIRDYLVYPTLVCIWKNTSSVGKEAEKKLCCMACGG
jgi:hypothetical protein